MATITVHRKGYHRKAYTRKDGTHVKASSVEASTFKVKGKGELGKTPKSERWYNPQVHTDWDKHQPAQTRRQHMLHAHKSNELAAARACQALANVTTDRETKKAARADALYFYDLHKRK